MKVVGAFILFFIVALQCHAFTEPQKQNQEFQQPDCGLNCAYIFTSLNGKHASLDQLRSKLGPQTIQGYSLYDISQTIKSLGIYNKCYNVNRDSWMPDRPAICFFRGQNEGHFVVVRPVGTTNTMVQIYDPPHTPYITDLDHIKNDPHWTGQVLEPLLVYEHSYIYVLIVLLGCSIGFYYIRKKKRLSI